MAMTGTTIAATAAPEDLGGIAGLAARVMTAVDEALDVLINHTGLVGR